MQTKNISDQLSEHATSLVKWMDEKLSKKLNIDIEVNRVN